MRVGHLLPQLLVADTVGKRSGRADTARLYQNSRVASARARRSPMDANGERILGAMQPYTGYGYADLMQRSGLSEMLFGPALDSLIRACRVEKTLDWRGPFYSLPC